MSATKIKEALSVGPARGILVPKEMNLGWVISTLRQATDRDLIAIHHPREANRYSPGPFLVVPYDKPSPTPGDPPPMISELSTKFSENWLWMNYSGEVMSYLVIVL